MPWDWNLWRAADDYPVAPRKGFRQPPTSKHAAGRSKKKRARY